MNRNFHYFVPDDLKTRFLPFYTASEIRRLVEDEPVIVLPVGSVEQHGPHLSIYTDTLLPTAVLGAALVRLEDDERIYFLPPLAYGVSIEHSGLGGTITLRSTTFLSLIGDILHSLAQIGMKKVVLLNGHGGNINLLGVAAREAHIDTGMDIFIASTGALISPESLSLPKKECDQGIHAGAVETAVIWKIYPDWVRDDERAREYPQFHSDLLELSLEGRIPLAWMTRDLSRTGILGDATLATPELGEQVFTEMVQALVHILREIKRFSMPRGEISQEKGAGRHE